MIVAGSFALPAAQAFGRPGFHQVVSITRRLPKGPGGRRIVVVLRDASRPHRRCASDHPLSGCATVDWADDPARPKVPPDGVFRNRVTVRTVAGPVTLYLHANGTLGRRPDPFRPG